MSLRDLSTIALCAPTEPSSSGAGPSSANPLAQLVEAVLPTTSRSERTTPVADRNASPAGHSEAALAIVSRTQARDNTSDLALRQGAIPQETQPPQLPPGLFPDSIVSNTHPIAPVPVLGPPPPIPAPIAGDATDVFERAFKDTVTQSSSRTAPSSSTAHANQLHSPDPATPFAPPLLVSSMYQRHRLRPSWRDFNSSFSAMSLNTPPMHPSHMMQTNVYHPNLLPTPQYHTQATGPGTHSAHNSAKQHAAYSIQSGVSSEATALASSSSIAQNDKTENGQSDAGSNALSWSEEFASLEGMDGPTFMSANASIDDLMYEETLQTAFQHWLRTDSSDDYQFSNTLNEIPTRSAAEALQEGLRAHTNGRLSAAVYHLEEAVQQQPNKEPLSKSKQALGWYVLGLSLADLDDDERAIQALMQGLRVYTGTQTGHRREDNPYLWQSLIALAVSHTNELEHSKALRVMREWIDFRNASQNGDGEAGSASLGGGDGLSKDLFRRSGHEDLLAALNRAASQSPEDPDLFIVLGIFHNLNRDYDSAATSFRHAATLRPETPGVWNKLGATLANGGNTDDALRAYRKAVDLQPALVRAWVNVGTAYSNRSEFEKAIRYYLKAINVSKETAAENEKLNTKTIGNNGQDGMQHVWGYMRSSLISLSRGELLHLVETRDADALRAHFNF